MRVATPPPSISSPPKEKEGGRKQGKKNEEMVLNSLKKKHVMLEHSTLALFALKVHGLVLMTRPSTLRRREVVKWWSGEIANLRAVVLRSYEVVKL